MEIVQSYEAHDDEPGLHNPAVIQADRQTDEPIEAAIKKVRAIDAVAAITTPIHVVDAIDREVRLTEKTFPLALAERGRNIAAKCDNYCLPKTAAGGGQADVQSRS